MLPPKTGYRHPSGHSHHLAGHRPVAPPIAMRSDEQYGRELADRMARLRGKLCSCGRPVASECCGRVSRHVAEAMNAIGEAE